MAADSPTINRPQHSERRLRDRARRMGLRIEKSRQGDWFSPQDPGRVWWLFVGRLGVILRDATLEDIANFLASDAETLEAAIDFAETLATMARYDVHDAGWSRRLDFAVIIQAVAQVSVLGAERDRRAPILVALQQALRRALEDLGQILEIERDGKLSPAIRAYAVSEVRRIVAEVKAGEPDWWIALRTCFARLRAEMDAGVQ